MKIATSKIDQIKTLHIEIEMALRTSLENGIKIGALLAEAKTELKHGSFTPWIKTNLPFTPRTARNYIKLFDNRDMLKTENVSVLSEAYKLLKGGEKETQPEFTQNPFIDMDNLRKKHKNFDSVLTKCDVDRLHPRDGYVVMMRFAESHDKTLRLYKPHDMLYVKSIDNEYVKTSIITTYFDERGNSHGHELYDKRGFTETFLIPVLCHRGIPFDSLEAIAHKPIGTTCNGLGI